MSAVHFKGKEWAVVLCGRSPNYSSASDLVTAVTCKWCLKKLIERGKAK